MAEEYARRLSEKFHVSMDAAQAALDAAQGDLLDAAEVLERDIPPQTQQVGFFSTAVPPAQEASPPAVRPASQPGQVWEKVWQMIRGIFQRPAANCLEVSYPSGAMAIPVLIVVLLLCVAPITFGLVVLGWTTGCRFALRGPDMVFPQVNQALDFVCDKMAEWKQKPKTRRK